MAAHKVLVAFDFDHTIVDDNTDVYVTKLAPGGVLPQEIKDTYNGNNWTDYMATIFKYLHDNGTTPDDITKCMKEIPFVEGYIDLFQHLSSDRYHTIIISDSNSVFIDCIIKEAGFSDVIDKVYTNPASFNSDGRLTIEHYHTQDWCNLSAKNLCKGDVLKKHMLTQASEGVIYDTVVYVGDGSNDYCPGLKLGDCDYLLPRTGFRLEKMVKKQRDELRCSVVMWKKGGDIMDLLKRL